MKVQLQTKLAEQNNVELEFVEQSLLYNIIMNVHTNKHEHMLILIGARIHCINCTSNVGLVCSVLTT